MNGINLKNKFSKFKEHWTPKIIAECNDQLIKIAKVKGNFVWHDHVHEDEMFYVVKGTLFIDLEDKTIELNEGEMTVIPKGIKHRPRTNDEEVWIMLFEPKSTKHTGNVKSDFTNNQQAYI